MKRTSLLIALLAVAFGMQSQILGEPIVHWDFAEGIPVDFINEGLNDAIWEYRGPTTEPDNTVCSQGACGVGSDPIESLTADNGFVIFDSAWWDDNVDGCSGSGGPVEGPHDACLITPPMDLSGNSNLIFTFQQYFKHHLSNSVVSYSIDAGDTWVEFHNNGGDYLFSTLDDWVSINISEWAEGQTDVRFKFNFLGDHYWWCLDDIAIYSPNDNDLSMVSATYTLFDFDQEPDGYGDLEYSIYPNLMTSPLNIRTRMLNIGGMAQTDVVFNGVVTRNGAEVLNETDEVANLNPGSATTFALGSWTPPGNGDYHISYSVTQNETDQTPENNVADRYFSVLPNLYGRDEGPATSQYLGIELYEEAEFEMGNMFQSREAGLQMHSISFALGDSTTIGTTVTGRLYDRDDTSVILAETAPYTVNAWDLNSIGDSNFVSIPFLEPHITYDTTLYFAVVHHAGGSERARMAMSGTPPIETTYLRYPENNTVFYMNSTPMVRVGLFAAADLPGCTDLDADNYDAAATIEDYSCRYPGCTFEEAVNYEANANWDDDSCLFAGCTDPEADNYDDEAVQDDGSCEYWGCTNPEAANYDPDANVDDGTCQVPGCTDSEAVNYNEFATEDDGSCLYGGCTHPAADNYDPTADVDDGSCLFSGCTDPEADNYDDQANTDDGSCEYHGCTDPEADNYDDTANVDDGTCEFWGCTDIEADNYDPTANTEDGSCEYHGCTDSNATNYDSTANVDDGSCVFAEAYFLVSDTVACGSLTVIVTNQTTTSEDGICTLDWGDDTVENTCQDTWEHTYGPGEFTISYTYSVSDVVSEFSATIVVHALPDAPIASYNADTGIASCTNCEVEDTIEWLLDGNPTGIVSFNFNPDSTGDYSIVLTDINGCMATGEALNIIVVGVEELSGTDMNLYPVPASTTLTVVVSGVGGHLELIDLQGRLLAVRQVDGGRVVLDVRHLANGTYVLRWVNGLEQLTRKVTVAH